MEQLNIRAIAGNLKISIEELACRAGIDPSHLKSVSSGRASMTADDLVKLAKYTNLSPFEIKIKQ